MTVKQSVQGMTEAYRKTNIVAHTKNLTKIMIAIFQYPGGSDEGTDGLSLKLLSL